MGQNKLRLYLWNGSDFILAAILVLEGVAILLTKQICNMRILLSLTSPAGTPGEGYGQHFAQLQTFLNYDFLATGTCYNTLYVRLALKIILKLH